MYYGHWLYHGPFDVGTTTLNGLGVLKDQRNNPDPNLSHQAAKGGAGAGSLSNGSLMKITPIAVWSQNLSIEDLETCVKADVSLMHSKSDMWDICSAYCIAIGILCKNVDKGYNERANMAIEAIRSYGQREGKTEFIGEWFSTA